MDMLSYQCQSLVDLAYSALKKDIAERTLIPGQKVNIREIHERYGISETPIKQALNRLISEGLVENLPRKGMRVHDIRREEIAELFDIRLMIETYHIPSILRAFRADPAIQTKLESVLQQHLKIIESPADLKDYFASYHFDQEFHQLYIQCAGNRRLAKMYSTLGTHVYSHYIYGKQSKEDNMAGGREHEAIFQALLSENETEIRRTVEIHIANAKEKVVRNLTK